MYLDRMSGQSSAGAFSTSVNNIGPIKLVLVDNDGTFIPGTEVRNRTVLQGIVDKFTASTAADKASHTIDWAAVGGKAEPLIHDWICSSLNPAFANYISSEDFTKQAKEGYRITEPDYASREGLVTLLTDLKENGIGAAIVTNSDREPIMHALKQSFAQIRRDISDVFPIIVTADDVKEQGLQMKPSPDPFMLALNVWNKTNGTDIKPHEVLILEDSSTGVASGKAMTGNHNHVVQFVDLAPACANAGHHVTDVAEIRTRFFSHLALNMG